MHDKQKSIDFEVYAEPKRQHLANENTFTTLIFAFLSARKAQRHIILNEHYSIRGDF